MSSDNGAAAEARSDIQPLPEHVDVLVVGAGLSGIGAACQLSARCPSKTFTIVERRENMGGTWDLFRYPGIRSDSDMFTLGYSFRLWKESEAIADGEDIRKYIRETAEEYGVDEKIHYEHRVLRAEWSSAEARWTVDIEKPDGSVSQISCSFLYGNTGYYNYDEGFTPEFEGRERFTGAGGTIIHPQHWPEDLDYTGKRVVIIGSGATAVTLVPAMAPDTEHVTMLQRSPTYIVALPNRDAIGELISKVLPDRMTFPIVRWKNVLQTMAFFQLSRRVPGVVRRFLQGGVKRQLPDYDIDPNFVPTYNPWDQRVCLVPDGDLFRAIRHGDASVVTDTIETFTEKGLTLVSGTELEADIIITATGLNLQVAGGIEMVVDGVAIDPRQTVGYKGMMLSGIPNFAMTLGYTNASWTLKADLVSEYVCRLLNHMDEQGYAYFTPVGPGPEVETVPFIDLKAGYVLRSIEDLPRQGVRSPWRLNQNYPLDLALIRHGKLEDEGITFSPAPQAAPRERSAV